MATLNIAADEIVERVNFTYTSSSPFTLFNLLAGDEINRVLLVITTAFDDVSAAARIGTVATPDLVFGPTDTDITKGDSQWECSRSFEITTTEIFRLLISPGSSSQGSGYVLFRIRRV